MDSAGHSLSELYFRHIGELCSFLAQRLKCRETARELAHETFVRYLARCEGEVQNPRALLYRIAGNLAIDHHRSLGARQHFVGLEECEELACEQPGPERIVAARQRLRHLAQAVEALPPQCRRIFIRHKFEGVSHADLATEYGITRNAIEKHLIRALVSLRLAMGDEA